MLPPITGLLSGMSLNCLRLLILISRRIRVITPVIINKGDAKALGKALSPFKIIKNAPSKVSSNIDFINSDSFEHFASVICIVLSSECIVVSFSLGGSCFGPTVFCYYNFSVAVAIPHPVEQFTKSPRNSV